MSISDTEIRRLEEIGAKTWPARTTERLHGWLLSMDDGLTRRANSVLPIGWDDGPRVGERIAEVELRYQDHGLNPCFKMTRAVLPADLDDLLDRRGYRAEGHKPCPDDDAGCREGFARPTGGSVIGCDHGLAWMPLARAHRRRPLDRRSCGGSPAPRHSRWSVSTGSRAGTRPGECRRRVGLHHGGAHPAEVPSARRRAGPGRGRWRIGPVRSVPGSSFKSRRTTTRPCGSMPPSASHPPMATITGRSDPDRRFVPVVIEAWVQTVFRDRGASDLLLC